MATATEPTVLDGLKDQRTAISDEWNELIEKREDAIKAFDERQESDDDKPTDEERDAYAHAGEEYRTAYDELEQRFNEYDQRINALQRKAERRKVADENTVEVADDAQFDEPLVYRKDNAHETSYWKDLVGTDRQLRAVAKLPSGGWGEADERLARHGKMMEKVVEVRGSQAKRAAETQIEQAEAEFRRSAGKGFRGFEASPFEKRGLEQRANPSRGPGVGGEFVPPLWLVEDDFIPYLRAGRTIAPQLRNMPVPPGTDTIKLPKIKLGAEVAPQLQDNAGVASRDIETEFVEAAIKTLAGQEDVAIQLIEQSPGQVFDRVVQEDLLEAYNLTVDQNVSYGTGANYTTLNAGTIRGLFPGTSWGAVARESASAITPQVILQAMGANWSHLAKERYDTSNVHHFINPSIAAFLASATDTEKEKGRLLVNATDFPNFNISGQLDSDSTPAEGMLMKTPLGPNVYHTVNIPEKSNKAATALEGSSYSYCATVKTDDCWFFESDLRARVLPEVVSGTLQVRFQVYAYVGLLVRYGPSLQFAGGTPFAAAPELGGYKY
ncbi:MAG: phage major capsid protein [Candidatus Sulfotelmatobacter sp.]